MTQTHVVKIKKIYIYTTLNLCIFLEDDANNKQIINSKQNTKKYMNVIFKYLHFLMSLSVRTLQIDFVL